MKDDKSLIYIAFALVSVTLTVLCLLSNPTSKTPPAGSANAHSTTFRYASYKSNIKRFHSKLLSTTDRIALKQAYLSARQTQSLKAKDIDGFNSLCKSCLAFLFLFGVSYSSFDKRFGKTISNSLYRISQFNPAQSAPPPVIKETIEPLAEGSLLQNERLEVIMPLGAGGMSTTYLAKVDGKKLVCLKETIIPANIDDDIKEKWQQIIEREARLLSKLNHRQIAKVLDSFSERSRHYIVLDYVPGVTLREYVRFNGAQSAETVLRWAHDIACILDYLHNQSPAILHRDLTPDNVVVKTDKTVVLIDFGAAIEFKGPITGTSIGKRCYMPPEQFRGKATPASDIYALGATMHFLLTGEDPIALSASHPGKINESVSPEIDTLVAGCTQLLEQERMCQAKDLLLRIKENLLPYDCPTQNVLWHPGFAQMQVS